MKTKIATALVTGALFAATVLPAAAFADNSCTITGNGAFSYNKCRIKVTNTTVTVQKNKAIVGNLVVAAASTGYNGANGNTTGTGDVSVDTGSATVTVTITNVLNQTNP